MVSLTLSHKVTKVTKQPNKKSNKVTKVTKLNNTIKVSEENFKRLWSLAGTLQEERGTNQTPDDAVTYLFENQRRKENK
jgi:hypothetical protein